MTVFSRFKLGLCIQVEFAVSAFTLVEQIGITVFGGEKRNGLGIARAGVVLNVNN